MWTAVRRETGLPSNEQTNFIPNKVNDILVVDITRRGQKMTRIVSIYDQREGDTGETPVR